MGILVNGEWKEDKDFERDSEGRFVRSGTQFKNMIGEDEQFPAEKDRYHLYVSLACPWAHRTLIFRELKGLQNIISVSIVHTDMLEKGWELKDEKGRSTDSLYGFQYLHQLYSKADPSYSGRVTVPVLWDKKQETIVNNDSAYIIRMFNKAFNELTGDRQDFYPKVLQSEIDEINELVYHNINNGVYKCGFATTQKAYEEAFANLFNALNEVEMRLGRQPYLVDKQLTEADWRLFTTLIRFDAVYFGHFKANLKRIKDYSHLSQYLKKLYLYPGIRQTVNMNHIKRHYYFSHKHINPTQIVPVGPELDYLEA
ncbi:glutathione S-transferase family protein [Legionella israelensis]|uniref:Glutathione S-transferase family protein n=1 Tax=Legionella israelensis TaxID=454 RepID=A0AAX1EJP1_9GAMM|nr:glutathione S-transferase family protein [Legionella israelensis]QBR85253.1 glutathione S-transferase family protein [Legionella israelensis]